MEATETDPLPLVTAEVLTAVCTAAGERLDCNESWRTVFGDDGLWGWLPTEDVRFATDYVTEAARGALVSQQVFLVEPPGAEQATPVLMHFFPIRLPGYEVGALPVNVVGEVLREPASWAAEQTRRRRLELLGRMTMGVAHDFNNLLTTVLGHAELMHDDLSRIGADAGVREHLRTLERAATDGAALVRKIQQYIRNEKDEREEPVELHALAGDVLTLTRPYWYNEPRRRGIAIVVEPELRPVPPILGTPTELREVMVNLVLNAVQAMPAGGTLAVRTLRRDERTVLVEVSDSGVGMSERVRRRIFEPLYTTKGATGTGMGLTVSQGIVQEHNGRIEVESTPGRGTTFRLLFPVGAAAPAPEVAAAVVVEARPLRVLVVDDEPMVRLVTAKLLRLRGHEVAEAEGGPDALIALETSAVDLVVTDLSMPDMSGRELAAEIRLRFPSMPVVLLTGDTDAEAESADIKAVVRKPFQLDVLEAALQSAMR
jgi:signal transduction histidine kinase